MTQDEIKALAGILIPSGLSGLGYLSMNAPRCKCCGQVMQAYQAQNAYSRELQAQYQPELNKWPFAREPAGIRWERVTNRQSRVRIVR